MTSTRKSGTNRSSVVTGEFEALDPPEEIVIPPPTIGLSLRDRWADLYMTQMLENCSEKDLMNFDAKLAWARAYSFADIGLRARDQTKR